MAIEDDIAFFERVPTLGLLGRQALRILAIGAESRYVHGGDVLFNAGDEADAGYVIQEGSFLLGRCRTTARASRSGPARCLGELALLTETTRPVTATALEPSTVLRIPRSLFFKMLEGYPGGRAQAARRLAARTDQSTREIHNVRAALDAREPK